MMSTLPITKALAQFDEMIDEMADVCHALKQEKVQCPAMRDPACSRHGVPGNCTVDYHKAQSRTGTVVALLNHQVGCYAGVNSAAHGDDCFFLHIYFSCYLLIHIVYYSMTDTW